LSVTDIGASLKKWMEPENEPVAALTGNGKGKSAVAALIQINEDTERTSKMAAVRNASEG
jgi:hypothetical protein